MNLKEYFNKISIKEIEAFVEEQTAEDLFTEFKTANFPNGLEFDKKNFSKCLSGFSNSSGGILVWGISAKENKNKPDVANELKPIKNVIDFETYLKKNEGNAVIPHVEGVEYKRVLIDENYGYIIVLIPPSDRAPHMALFSDKRYYKRSGDSFYISEHFDIMDMMNRKTSPKLVVGLKNIMVSDDENKSGYFGKFEGIVSIENIGRVSAKHIYLTVIVNHPYTISRYGLDGNNNSGMKTLRNVDYSHKYYGGSELVIHPETCHDVDKIVINEICGAPIAICDLEIQYSIVAEGMQLIKDTIIVKKDEILEKKRIRRGY